MNGRFLLDTNIVIALFADDDLVIEFLSDAPDVFIPSIVLGELYLRCIHQDRQKPTLNE